MTYSLAQLSNTSFKYCLAFFGGIPSEFPQKYKFPSSMKNFWRNSFSASLSSKYCAKAFELTSRPCVLARFSNAKDGTYIKNAYSKHFLRIWECLTFSWLIRVVFEGGMVMTNWWTVSNCLDFSTVENVA